MKGGKSFLSILLVAVLLSSSVFASEIRGYVNDEAGIIDSQYTTEIEAVLRGLHEAGVAEVAVVTVNSLEGKAIESYAIDLAQGNLGDAEKNNGLLILVALEEREYRFEVGRGLEADLPDSIAGRIGRQYLVENFRSGEYGKGIYEATLAVRSVLAEDTESQYYVSATSRTPLRNLLPFLIFIIFFAAFMIPRSKTYRRRDRMFDAAMMAAWMFGGRRGGGGSFGGGFGGFGGGGFGGGGAGGGW